VDNEKPVLLQGKVSVDNRGCISFVNDFDMSDVKRFYIVKNHQPNFIRAWHAHRRERKYVMAIRGAAIVVAIPLSELEVVNNHFPEDMMDGMYNFTQATLSGGSPAIFCIPPGYGNGFKTLTPDTELIFFSSATLEESKNDDIRFSAQLCRDAFDVEER
jgi:dTDP-4-dehydrorhamnose 3,5-epimerase